MHYRISSWNKRRYGSVHIHGHNHNFEQNMSPYTNCYNAWAPSLDYIPRPLEWFFEKYGYSPTFYCEKPAGRALDVDLNGIRSTTGKRIRELREKKNWTAKDLTIAMGLKSISQVYRWESGKTTLTCDTLYKLCVALGTTPNYLLGC